MSERPPSPERILQLSIGSWALGILGAAVEHRLFKHLEAPTDAAALARAAGISTRGAQAVLDGLVGLGLVAVDSGKYRNTSEASTYLVEAKPTYLGGLARVNLHGMSDWMRAPEIVKTGHPPPHEGSPEHNPFWEELVPSIAALSVPSARIAAERLGLSRAGEISWLEVGGGSGIYSAIWLGLNPKARGVQLDWPNVNRIARAFVAKFGVGDRFQTVDGDMHKTDFGEGRYDYGIYSHIAHGEGPERNSALFGKFRRALKPGGTLVVNDFVLNDDRTGHPFALIFHSNMLMFSPGGASWRRADYVGWLQGAGFSQIDFVPTETPATLIFAR